ncbi:polyribonucleotide nucleotidyltransferase [Planctomyces bekefii]|uniref:Polyribonucleotide nucleotidyltransferase n=1 Tax=Planctomyces bekefii TaxID=1653850 RepID=A0A5C6M689_9PLAN|nr:polyribonucleotide nucleotidyltransferase [Planctomyces bekefii]
MSFVREVTVGDKLIRLEFQKFAKLANGSVMVSCGDTQVLVTVCASDEPKEGQDFFPLTVDYLEKFYAAGRIPGGFFKREAKPTERESLNSRVIDRPLRPSFPEDYMNETQIIATVMSYEPAHHPAPLALLGASAALMISDIPFNGPVASLRMGMKDGKLILDPPLLETTDLDLTVACRPDAILMVEAGANFLSEDQMLDAITTAHQWMKPLFDVQYEIQKAIGKPKREVPKKTFDANLFEEVLAASKAPIAACFEIGDKLERNKALKAASKQVISALNPDGDDKRKAQIKLILEDVKYKMMREQILGEKKRIGGRGFKDVRNITCEPRVLKRPHGSAMFQRGETQAVATVTLGAGDDELRIDSIHSGDERKAFLLHYNFPPFSTGEAKPQRGLSRREMGHGALAERAIAQILPDKSKFGYTIRLVSDVLESNGSSSMATVCAGTMALLDAGVPIVEPVAGIAMGLIKEGDRYAVLSDILGDEDHLGDMDFKVCGGENGITALQMDIKIGGLSKEIMREALAQAREGRRHILGKMKSAIAEPKELSQFAPRIFQLKIPSDRIRDLIGPGGKMVKKIVADTGVKIDIQDDGMVNIVSPDVLSAEAAKSLIRSVTSDPDVGGIYLGTVKKIMDFGAFIEIKPGTEGLCHISELEEGRVAKVTDVLKEGDECLVKVLDIDRQGKIKLSRRAALGKKPTTQG